MEQEAREREAAIQRIKDRAEHKEVDAAMEEDGSGVAQPPRGRETMEGLHKWRIPVEVDEQAQEAAIQRIKDREAARKIDEQRRMEQEAREREAAIQRIKDREAQKKRAKEEDGQPSGGGA